MDAFFAKLLQTVLSGDLNVIGLLLGFVGGLLITLFGLPSRRVLSEGSYTEVQTTPRMRCYDALSLLGLVLVVAGFAFQLVPAVQGVRTQ